MSDQEIFPLAVLIDDLKHENAATRVAAMGRLKTIATALGEERTRGELLEFLTDVAQEDEDEILTSLADQLGEFVPLVGGSPYAYLLLKPLSDLVTCEEPTVREAAVASLSNVAPQMPADDIVSKFLPLLQYLASSDWFSSRIATAGIFPATLSALYGSGAAEKASIEGLVSIYDNLVRDDAPMVRRAAGTNLPKVISAIPPQDINVDAFMAMLIALVHDEQDSVKLLSVDVAIALGEVQPTKLVPMLSHYIFQLLEDKSWRVRYQAADRFSQLAHSFALNPEEAKRSYAKLLELFVAFTNDPEGEVRAAISKQVVGFSEEMLTADEILTHVVPCLENLTNDPNEHVRVALASKVSYLSPKLGKDRTTDYLLPLFLQMLRDEHSEVRLQIISNLQIINEIIGIDRLSESLLPAIADLAKDKQWRVLLAVIEYSPLLAEQLGVDFFNKELVPLVLNWLWDPVWAIRDAAAHNLLKLADVFSIEWLEQEIVPKLVGLNQNANYLYRLTALLAVKTIASQLTTGTLVNSILPFIIELSEDPVPNVRFNCATTFAIVANKINAEKPELVANEILPVLEKQTEDNDSDVRFFATQALRSTRADSFTDATAA